MRVPDRAIAELVRAPAALSVPGDALAGAAAADRLGVRAAGLSAASVCLYLAGMAANDWADRDLDAATRPERPVPSGRVAPVTALRIAAALSAAGLTLAAAVGGRRALAVAVPLTGGAWLYDLRLKDTAAGPAAMAACRGLDVLLGASLGGARPGKQRRAAAIAAAVAVHTGTVTLLSRREVTGGGRVLPGVTLAATAALGAVTAVAPGRTRLSTGLTAWYAASYGLAQARALARPDAGRMRAATATGITVLPALQAGLIARSGTRAAAIAGLTVAAAAPAGRALAKKMPPT
ncbi:MAG TPA: UbiA family prenyltransferase [Streptosporangiaceae bacterium]|nr:UbiA family prenyltransferase [Streptosporangiaceae bacterium]